jgi:hypothetical protein
LKEHGVSYLHEHNVQGAAILLAVLGEKEILVGGVHADQRDYKGQVTNQIVDDNVQSVYCDGERERCQSTAGSKSSTQEDAYKLYSFTLTQ